MIKMGSRAAGQKRRFSPITAKYQVTSENRRGYVETLDKLHQNVHECDLLMGGFICLSSSSATIPR